LNFPWTISRLCIVVMRDFIWFSIQIDLIHKNKIQNNNIFV
jgi:hypothetical protein